MSFRRTLRHVPGMIALAPAAMVVLVVYLGCTIWAIGISMTASRILPGGRFVGLEQYAALFGNERWQVSIGNLAIFGVLFVVAAIVLGFSLAILLDQKIRGEDFFRSIYLYPYSMSFVVTGLVWQWMLTPGSGIEKMVRDFGFAGFRFDWIVDQSMVVYTLVLAAVWQASGVIMAIALAGLRGIDEEIWKAVRIDGIPAWRAYISIILPMMRGSIGTCVVLLSISVVRLYDLVVAMTKGGPGVASEVPAKFVMDYLFTRQNIGLATAGTTVMLMTVLAVLAPYAYLQYRRTQREGTR
jgi:glucose/mannose transport system permease protein